MVTFFLIYQQMTSFFYLSKNLVDLLFKVILDSDIGNS